MQVANNRQAPARFKARTVLTLAGVALALAAIPAGANAAVRTGTIQDAKDVPTKDALGNNSCGEYRGRLARPCRPHGGL